MCPSEYRDAVLALFADGALGPDAFAAAVRTTDVPLRDAYETVESLLEDGSLVMSADSTACGLPQHVPDAQPREEERARGGLAVGLLTRQHG
jgi:hypothetical protein